MRLIDADALIRMMRSDPLYFLVERFNVEGVINAAPTADAIPVSFLEGLRDNARSAEAAETITEILRLWDKEAKG